MNKNAKKWVAALRSGEFKQAKGKLRRDGAYCCLGVACELYARSHKRDPKWKNMDGIWRFGNEEAILPGIVQKWIGLNDWAGNYADSLGLASLNDEGESFERIADIIESEPEGLFSEFEK